MAESQSLHREKDTISLNLPAGFEKDIVVRTQTKKDVKPRQESKMLSFRLDNYGSNAILIEGKIIRMVDIYKILVAHGLSKTCPKIVQLPNKFINIDWNPHCYIGGARPLSFVWDDVQCSIVGTKDYLYFRVHIADSRHAVTIMKSFSEECLRTYQEPVPSDSIMVYSTKLSMQGFVWNQLCTRKMRDMDTIYIDEPIKQALIQELEKFHKSSDMYDRFGVTWKRVHLFHGPPGTGKTR